MGKGLFVLLFAVTAGLTMSGITANLYKLLAKKPDSMAGRALHLAVMVVAGPSVMIENSTASLRKRDCSRLAYGFAVSIAAYWSLALGLFAMSVGEALY